MTETPTRAAVIRWRALVVWTKRLVIVRVWLHYLNHRGPLMAGGMTYSSLFSVFAGVWISFSILGIFQTRDDQALTALITFIDSQVPGLIDTGTGGLIAADQLTDISATPTWTSIVAAGGLLFTSMGWMRAGQNGVRAMFGLVGKEWGALLGQIITFLSLIALALLVGIGAAASVLTLSINSAVLSFLGVEPSSAVSALSSRIAAGAISVALDFSILSLFVYVLAGVRPRWRVFWPPALVGAIAMSTLKIGGSLLAGSAGSNPLLASFTLLIGYMLWLNIVNQTFFLCMAWLAVRDADARARDGDPARARARRRARSSARRARPTTTDAPMRGLSHPPQTASTADVVP